MGPQHETPVKSLVAGNLCAQHIFGFKQWKLYQLENQLSYKENPPTFHEILVGL